MVKKTKHKTSNEFYYNEFNKDFLKMVHIKKCYFWVVAGKEIGKYR